MTGTADKQNEETGFDIDKIGEKMTQSINKVANNLRKLTMKYVSFCVSVDELNKDKANNSKEAVTKFNDCKEQISNSLAKYSDELENICSLIDNDKHVRD